VIDLDSRNGRLETANRIIEIISEHGRRFFSLNADRREPVYPDRISRFEIIKDRLWFRDKYTGKRIYVLYRAGRWRGFSEGGTLRSLVENLADYILKGAPVRAHFGPWADWICHGDLWGYGDSMADVRRRIHELCSENAPRSAHDESRPTGTAETSADNTP
jgi:hypothetical protein